MLLNLNLHIWKVFSILIICRTFFGWSFLLTLTYIQPLGLGSFFQCFARQSAQRLPEFTWHFHCVPCRQNFSRLALAEFAVEIYADLFSMRIYLLRKGKVVSEKFTVCKECIDMYNFTDHIDCTNIARLKCLMFLFAIIGKIWLRIIVMQPRDGGG